MATQSGYTQDNSLKEELPQEKFEHRTDVTCMLNQLTIKLCNSC